MSGLNLPSASATAVGVAYIARQLLTYYAEPWKPSLLLSASSASTHATSGRSTVETHRHVRSIGNAQIRSI